MAAAGIRRQPRIGCVGMTPIPAHRPPPKGIAFIVEYLSQDNLVVKNDIQK